MTPSALPQTEPIWNDKRMHVMRHFPLTSRHSSLPRFSVIVPVMGEELRIGPLVEHVFSLPAPAGVELLVVDGSADGSSLKALETWWQQKASDLPARMGDRIHCLSSPPGRGRQMNTGAQTAKGEVLLFLHADTMLPHNAFHAINNALEDFRIAGGAFSLQIDSQWWIVRAIGKGATWRTRLSRLPFGDQALFFRSRVFHALGGFQEIPIMEDYEFMRRMARQGQRIALLPEAVITSGRRWEKEGPLSCSLRNMILRGLYNLGIGPQTLARYYPQNED